MILIPMNKNVQKDNDYVQDISNLERINFHITLKILRLLLDFYFTDQIKIDWEYRISFIGLWNTLV